MAIATPTTMTADQMRKYPRLAARYQRSIGNTGGNVRPGDKPKTVNPDNPGKASLIGNGAFDKGVNWYLNDARLSPDDDPYMQKWLDLYSKRSQDAFDRSTYDLHNQLAGNHMLGTGYYQGQLAGATAQYNDAYEQNLTKYLSDTRNTAIQDRLKALGLISDRDIAKTNANAQVQSARISIQPGMASARLAGQEFRANQPWNDLKNMIDVQNGMNQLGGYTMSNSYIPQGYTGSPWASAVSSGLGGALAMYGARG